MNRSDLDSIKLENLNTMFVLAWCLFCKDDLVFYESSFIATQILAYWKTMHVKLLALAYL